MINRFFRQPVILFIALWLLTTLYLLVFPTRHYTPDAVNNLVFIEAGDEFEAWHSQHLLGQWPSYGLYWLANGSVRAWQIMRLTQALFGGLTVSLVFVTLYTLTAKTGLAVVGALALWFSYGFWHFHSDPDIYSIGYTAVALLLWLYLRYLLQPSVRRIVWVGVASALAILAHQLNLELVGLIGLSLLWWVIRKRLPWQHVALDAGVCAALVLVGYGFGWLNASAYYQAAFGKDLPFLNWTLRYFGMARAGEASWGVTLAFNTLPLSGYTWLTTWILPPLRSEVTSFHLVLLLPLLVGGVLLALAAVFVRWRWSESQLTFALVCVFTLMANLVSGWWWQAGNIKFYLFMQLPTIYLLALYAQLPLAKISWQRWLRPVGFSGLTVGLALWQVSVTLPYETRGGVFAVANLVESAPAPVYFQDAQQATTMQHISAAAVERWQPSLCQESFPEGVIWVLDEPTAADCPALAAVRPVLIIQTDRTRKSWLVYRRNTDY